MQKSYTNFSNTKKLTTDREKSSQENADKTDRVEEKRPLTDKKWQCSRERCLLLRLWMCSCRWLEIFVAVIWKMLLKFLFENFGKVFNKNLLEKMMQKNITGWAKIKYVENFLSKKHRPLYVEFFLSSFLLIFFRHSCCSNNIYFNKLTDNRLFNVLSAGFNASIQSSWKVVSNAAKVLYFILAHPVFTLKFEQKKRKKWQKKTIKTKQ